MPQLDIFTFFPQIFWGFCFFFMQFFIVSYYFLPLLASSLKFKQKYLSVLFQKDIPNKSTKFVQYEDNFLLLNSLKEIEKIFKNIYSSCKLSNENFRLKLLTETFKKINLQVIKPSFLLYAFPRFYSFLFNSINSKIVLAKKKK